ncbi:MAG: hypothetical protein GKS02_12710 [Alphaproteobacteria bacterium]|nr:hypothetical protein [Alphaproteobacteria bacterium]
MVFHSYDPNRKLLISPTKGGQIFRISNGGVLIHNVDVVDGIQYLLQKIPAGHYYLAEVQWGAYARTTMPSGSIAAEVKPGTVNYVGNLVFKTPFSAFGEVGIKLNGRNDIAARSFLANYAQIKPEMQNASPRIFKLNCMLEDGVEACYAP